MDKKDSKLTKVTEEESLWKHILLHCPQEDLDVIVESMYQSARMKYEYAMLNANNRLLQS